MLFSERGGRAGGVKEGREGKENASNIQLSSSKTSILTGNHLYGALSACPYDSVCTGSLTGDQRCSDAATGLHHSVVSM